MDKKVNRLICPVCKAAIIKEGNNYFPFCSPRCKDTDLYHWLTGKYKISSPLKVEDEEDEEEDLS
ncbi:MAG: DNA gyrase inhibitor YacG [bacterium]|nr:DNA gyrase inhibitor YacG [bacterium]